MVANAVLLVCAQALLAQCITSQCIGAGYNGIAAPWNAATPYIAEVPLAVSWATTPCAATPFATAEWAPSALSASNGGGFPITSASPLAVTGVSMASENLYEGPLGVSGAVPFLGAVALEGALPTAGAGAIAYGCGNGNVAMLTEDISPGPYAYGPGIAAPLAYEAAFAGPLYGYDRGCGYGTIF